MALEKQTLNINFGQGLDTKTDNKQVPPGRFLRLENSVFTKEGLLQKRNGNGFLPALPDESYTYLSTFKDNLTAIGNNIIALSTSNSNWVNKGSIHPGKLSTQTLIRSNTNQSQVDMAISANGLVCTVFIDEVPVVGTVTPKYKYAIAEEDTGQNIIAPTLIAGATGTVSGAPRVFILNNYFVIVFSNTITATPHLYAIAINTTDPTQVVNNINLSSQYAPASTLAFDGFVANDILYLAWNGSDLGGAIRISYLNRVLTQFSTVAVTGYTGDVFSVTADVTTSTPTVYVSFYDSGSQDGYTTVLDSQLNNITDPQKTIDSLDVRNLTSVAQNGSVDLFYETINTYSYDNSIETDFISTINMLEDGTVGSPSQVARSVGLASKAFLLNEVAYFLSIYNSNNQPTYFLLNNSGEVVYKLAYSNGSGYYNTGLPSASVSGSIVKIPYLFKDLIQSVNKTQGLLTSAAIYSQTGINLASFTFGSSNIVTSEIGNDLYLTGGFLSMYDGYVAVEHGFHLWPDYVEAGITASGGAMSAQKYFYQAIYEWSDNQGNIFRSAPSIPLEVDATNTSVTPITFHSIFSSGVSTITVSSTTGLVVGQVLTDSTTGAHIQAGTYITAINGSTITLSLPTAGNSASSPGDVLSTSDIISVTVHVPTLRLTYKTANPVKIVIYRFSESQQNYFQVTSILNPILNTTTADSISFVDANADSSILGNSLIYTTGGVLENIAMPATDVTTLFDNRLWAIHAEDKNLLLFSKQVVEGVPVEPSDLLTVYVAPTAATAGASGTGVLKALSALDDKLIMFKMDAIYYLNGMGPDNTGANSQYSQPTFITSVVGCSNQQSIVFTPRGLLFESDKGIWLLGRDLSTQYIGAPVEELTQNATVLSAVNIVGTNQVRFTLDTGITLMYDYYYDRWGTFTGVPAISSTLYQSLHTYIDSNGQVFQETPGIYLDGTRPVLMAFTTSWLNLAGVQGYQRAYYFYLIGTYLSPHKLTLSIGYDYNSSPTQASVITPDNYSGPWGSESNWGGGESWGGPNNLEQWRVFLAQQKCESFQISLKESFDPTYGTKAGAGFTLSGLDVILGMKSGYPRIRASRSVG